MFRLRKSSPLDVGVHEQLDSLEPRKRTYGYLGEGNAINLVTNLIFTPIQFGMRNLPLAAVDVLIVWGTIIWMMIAVWQHYRWLAVAPSAEVCLGVVGDRAAIVDHGHELG